MAVRLTAALLAGAALVTFGSVSDARSPVYLPSKCYDQKVKPRRVILACGDAGFYATGLKWKRWGGGWADGRGVAHANNCDPSCAEGTFGQYPVRLVATSRKRCRNGKRQYTRVRYSFPEDSPFPADAPGTTNPVTRFPCPR